MLDCGQTMAEERFKGIIRQKRIIGGEKAEQHSHPWLVRLAKTDKSKGGKHPTTFCGGTILNRKYILTAAHCIDDL